MCGIEPANLVKSARSELEKNNKSEFLIFLKNEEELGGLIRDKYNMVGLLPTAQVWCPRLDPPVEIDVCK